MQHPSHLFAGLDCGAGHLPNPYTTKSLAPLPQGYTNVPPSALEIKEFTVPGIHGPVKPHAANHYTTRYTAIIN